MNTNDGRLSSPCGDVSIQLHRNVTLCYNLWRPHDVTVTSHNRTSDDDVIAWHCCLIKGGLITKAMQKTRVSAESCLRGRWRLILARATLFLAGAKETVRDFAIKLCWVSRKTFTAAIICSMKSKLITCDLKNSKKKNVTVFFANDSTCLLCGQCFRNGQEGADVSECWDHLLSYKELTKDFYRGRRIFPFHTVN